jgi:transcription initiation factor TFIIIB Brf1 subunit/transcription initiation factor TFIIB
MTISNTLCQTRDSRFQLYEAELELPFGVQRRAADILDDAEESGLARSRCHRTLIDAATLVACRENDIPLVADDFAQFEEDDGKEITAKQISKEARKIKRELKLHVMPTDASRFLEHYAERLDLSNKTRVQAERLLEIAEENGIAAGPSPTSIAAACIDAARRLTKEEVYQREIAAVSHVSEPQIRKHCHKLIGGSTA